MPGQKTVDGFQKLRVAVTVTGVMLALAVSGVARAADLKGPVERLDLKDGDSIVFYGDSITHQRLYTQYLEDYLYTRFPNKHLKIHNAGVSGSVAWEALTRFEGDVAAYKPKYVTVLLGMNDGNHEPFNQAIFDTYRRDMTTIFNEIKRIGARPIILSPTMFDARVRRAQRPDADAESTALYNAVLAYYGAWLEEQATEQGYGFVDLWGPMNNVATQQRESNPNFTLVPDSVHPGPAGHVVMAAAIVRDLDLPRQVSRLNIAIGASEQQKVDAVGGELSNLATTNKRLKFTWKADCLPWVLPEDAQAGAKLEALGHELSQESLEVHGLAAGQYALSIDGQPVGTYDSAQLEHGVDLQENSKTPQYQQALAVAQLNKQRNEGPIDALRNEWWNYQDYVDARRDAQQNPENAKCQEALSKATAQIAGMEDRVAQDDAAAKTIEDRIYEINKPVAHNYELVPSAMPAADQVAR